MTETELNRFRAVLTRADQLDEIQAASQRALAVCNLDRESNHLRDARAALRRIKDGSFGVCQECEEDIHLKRLIADRGQHFAYGVKKPQTAISQMGAKDRDLPRAA